MEQKVKERMVGAAVLVLAAVVFIPMILAGPPQERSGDKPLVRTAKQSAPWAQSAAAGSASAPSDAGFSSRIVPLGEVAPARSAADSSADKDASRRVVETPAQKPIVLPDKKQRQSPSMVVAPPPEPTAKRVEIRLPTEPKVEPKVIATPAVKDGWVVQLGSFSSSRNAFALRDRLKSNGYKAFARTSGKGAEAVTRVYIGPDVSREIAQKRVGRLLKETRLKGIVIRYPK